MKYFIALIAFIVILLSPVQTFAQQQSNGTMAEAKVLDIVQTKEISPQTKAPIRNVKIQITSGDLKGKTYTIQDNVIPTAYQLDYKKGDNVVVNISKDQQGNNTIYITDYSRNNALLILLGLFLIVTLIVGRIQGITSLVAMVISFLIIGKFIIPNIMLGNDPLFITFLGSLIIIPITYYISHGLNKKTTVAIVGTLITLLLTGVLAYFFSEFAKLTGFESEEAVYLQTIKGGAINIKSLLLSGIIISSLAVLNDITVSQASIVRSLLKSNPRLSIKELYGNAMSVGRDHVASLVNTLILVYAGASLPLFLLFNNAAMSYSLVINQEIIATEIVRTLVSSIGIIAAVPITTLLAAVVEKRK